MRVYQLFLGFSFKDLASSKRSPDFVRFIYFSGGISCGFSLLHDVEFIIVCELLVVFLMGGWICIITTLE